MSDICWWVSTKWCAIRWERSFWLNTVGQVDAIGIGYMGGDKIVYRGERGCSAGHRAYCSVWPDRRRTTGPCIMRKRQNPSQARRECCIASHLKDSNPINNCQLGAHKHIMSMASKTPSVQSSHARWLATTDGAHNNNHFTGRVANTCQLFAAFWKDFEYD